VEQAYAQYRNAWAQTTVDMLVGKVHDTLTDRFSPEQRERVRHVFNTIKEAQTKRRQAAKHQLNRDRTTFDRASAKYASMDISARKAVGSMSSVDGRGESCAHDLGQQG